MDPRLSAWESFYVIVGSSAAALIGLQFVVITLIADMRKRIAADAASVSAFGTPTVVHFGGALVISAGMSAPWPSPAMLSRILLLCGVGGMLYAALIVRRARRQTTYHPVAEDWVFYAILPFLAYAALALAGLKLATATAGALFGVGAVALGLLLLGIHNAWDTVTHLVLGGGTELASREE